MSNHPVLGGELVELVHLTNIGEGTAGGNVYGIYYIILYYKTIMHIHVRAPTPCLAASLSKLVPLRVHADVGGNPAKG
jgi:hypothetical protein